MYDFVTTIRRDPNKAAKWKLIERVMGPGNQDVLAMSVADMELPVLPDITEAIVKEATDCPMYGYTTATDSYYEAVIGWQAITGLRKESGSPWPLVWFQQ